MRARIGIQDTAGDTSFFFNADDLQLCHNRKVWMSAILCRPLGFNNSILGHPAPLRSCKIAWKMAKNNIGSLFWLLLNDRVFFSLFFWKGGGRVETFELCWLWKRSRLTYNYFHLYTCVCLLHFKNETTI